MPSYYVPKKNRCNGCSGITIGVGVSSFSQTTGIPSSSQNQIVNGKEVYTFYQTLTPSALQQKGLGNTMKKGSGGSSYADYMARKKGALQQYCNCSL